MLQMDADLVKIQTRMVQLIYRYLSSTQQKTEEADPDRSPSSSSSRSAEFESPILKQSEDLGNLSPDDKTKLLISLIDDLHDCADIMLNRSLAGQTELDGGPPMRREDEAPKWPARGAPRTATEVSGVAAGIFESETDPLSFRLRLNELPAMKEASPLSQLLEQWPAMDAEYMKLLEPVTKRAEASLSEMDMEDTSPSRQVYVEGSQPVVNTSTYYEHPSRHRAADVEHYAEDQRLACERKLYYGRGQANPFPSFQPGEDRGLQACSRTDLAWSGSGQSPRGEDRYFVSRTGQQTREEMMQKRMLEEKGWTHSQTFIPDNNRGKRNMQPGGMEYLSRYSAGRGSPPYDPNHARHSQLEQQRRSFDTRALYGHMPTRMPSMSPDSRQQLRPPVLCRVPARQPPAQPSETTAVNYYTGHISMLSPNHQNPNQYGGHTAMRGGGSSVQEHVAITSEDDFGDIFGRGHHVSFGNTGHQSCSEPEIPPPNVVYSTCNQTLQQQQHKYQ